MICVTPCLLGSEIAASISMNHFHNYQSKKGVGPQNIRQKRLQQIPAECIFITFSYYLKLCSLCSKICLIKKYDLTYLVCFVLWNPNHYTCTYPIYSTYLAQQHPTQHLTDESSTLPNVYVELNNE